MTATRSATVVGMAGLYLAQHTFQDVDDLSRDRYVNTFHALYTGTGSPDDTAYSQLIGPIVHFYDTSITGSGGNGVRDYMANHALGAGATVKVYALADAKPRTPRADFVYTPTPEGGTLNALPAECSLCISFQSALISGSNPQRHRGRIYLGPLNNLSVAVNAGQAARATAEATGFLVTAFTSLMTNLLTGPWQLVQYSPTAGISSPIQKVWCDNAYDTQRRRGVASTARSTAILF